MEVITKRKKNLKSKSSMKTKRSSKSKSNSKTRKQFKKFRKNGMGTRKMMRGGAWKNLFKRKPKSQPKVKSSKKVPENPYVFLNTSKLLPPVEEEKQYKIVDPETEINKRPSPLISNNKTAVFTKERKQINRTPENHAVLKFLQDKYENPYLQFSEIEQTEKQRKAIINKIKQQKRKANINTMKQQKRKNYMLEELVDRASELKNINNSVKPSLMGFSTKLNPQQTTL